MLRSDIVHSSVPLCGIYGIQNKLEPSKWYIGQSWDIHHRWKDYSKFRCSGQVKLYRALKKYGWENFAARIIELCDSNIPQEMLDLKETIWVNHYNSVEHGYNLTYGGGSHGKHSAESRQRMSEAQRGRVVSIETREKIAAALTGRKLSEFSEEHRKNLSNALKGNTIFLGKKHSEETKEKMSIIARNRVRKPMTDEHKRNIGLSHKGMKYTFKNPEERNRKISAAKIGKSNRNKGKVVSDATRIKISNSLKGKPLSEETKRKMTIAQQLRRNKEKQKEQVCTKME